MVKEIEKSLAGKLNCVVAAFLFTRTCNLASYCTRNHSKPIFNVSKLFSIVEMISFECLSMLVKSYSSKEVVKSQLGELMTDMIDLINSQMTRAIKHNNSLPQYLYFKQYAYNYFLTPNHSASKPSSSTVYLCFTPAFCHPLR